MKTTKEVAEAEGVSMVFAGRWALGNGVKKYGRDYLFTDEEYERFRNRRRIEEVTNGCAQVARELGLPETTVRAWAKANGVKKGGGSSGLSYVFTEKEKEKVRYLYAES